jgi:hypothetical protein
MTAPVPEIMDGLLYCLHNAVVVLQAFVATGTNIQLVFNPSTNGYSTADHGRECDFDKEHGKVSATAVATQFVSQSSPGVDDCACGHSVMLPHQRGIGEAVLFHVMSLTALAVYRSTTGTLFGGGIKCGSPRHAAEILS